MKRADPHIIDEYTNLSKLIPNKTYIVRYVELHDWNSYYRRTNSTVMWHTYLKYYNLKNISNKDVFNIFDINEYVSPVTFVDINGIKYQIHPRYWDAFYDICDAMKKKQNFTGGHDLPFTIKYNNSFAWVEKIQQKIGFQFLNMLQRKGRIHAKI